MGEESHQVITAIASDGLKFLKNVNAEKIHLEVKRFVRGRRYRLRGNGATES